MKRLTPAKATILMFGLVGVLVSAYVVKKIFAGPVDNGPSLTRLLPMPVADLPAGTLLTEDHMGMGWFPRELATPDMLLSIKTGVGRVAKVPLKAATPIHAEELYQPGEYPPLVVEDGMRAVTITFVDMESIVDGLIQPGEFVDVYFTPTAYQRDDRMRGGLTMMLFKGVKVIAMNRSYVPVLTERSANTVTLELQPDQANVLILAREKGRLSLTYNPDGEGSSDVQLSEKDRATLDEILGLKPLDGEEELPFVAENFTGSARKLLFFVDNRQAIGRVQRIGGGTGRGQGTSAGGLQRQYQRSGGGGGDQQPADAPAAPNGPLSQLPDEQGDTPAGDQRS